MEPDCRDSNAAYCDNRLYLPAIHGDQSIDERDFGIIQKDRIKEMEYWASVVKKAQKDKSLRRGIVAANNHYAGFGLATANSFRRIVGLKEVQWEEMKQKRL